MLRDLAIRIEDAINSIQEATEQGDAERVEVALKELSYIAATLRIAS